MDDSRITGTANDRPPPPRPDVIDDERDERPRRRYGPDYRKDREHLNLLSIFYFCFCGLQVFGLLGALLYAVIGTAMVVGGAGSGPGAPPPEIGYVMMAFGIVVLLISGTYGTCLGLTGLYLRRRQRPTFCFVIACLICLSVPLGTILGVFTILVLQRPSVKELFRTGDRPPADSDEDHAYA